MKHLILLTLASLTTLPAFAGELAFQVYHTKTITPDVERFYGQDQNPFATMFCKADAKQVMMVDARMRDLDGKTFHFATLKDCTDARAQARSSAKKCKAELVINTDTQSARFQLSNCKQF